VNVSLRVSYEITDMNPDEDSSFRELMETLMSLAYQGFISNASESSGSVSMTLLPKLSMTPETAKSLLSSIEKMIANG